MSFNSDFAQSHSMIATKADGRPAFASLSGKAWWGTGQVLDMHAPIHEVAQAAGITYSVIEAPAVFRGIDGEFRPTGKKALYRSDTGECLGVVGEKYKVHQPSEILGALAEMIRPDGWHVRTAGVLNNGARIFAFAFRDEGAAVGDKSWLENGLMLCTSYDGTLRSHARQTSIEPVCTNTVAAAFADSANKKKGSISHRSNFDAAQILADVGLTITGHDLSDSTGFEAMVRAARQMSETEVSETEARALLDGLLRGKPLKLSEARARFASAPVESLASPALDFAALLARPTTAASVMQATGEDTAKEHRNVGKILSLWQGNGIDADSHKGTAWGLFRSLTEWKDHHASRTADARIHQGQFGQTAAMAADFARLLTA